MENNEFKKDAVSEKTEEIKGNSAFFNFLKDFICGYLMGLAFIIPGFSGGSIAAIVGIYEKLINAITGLFKNFIKNLIILLPIGGGLILGALSLMMPIQWGLENFPIPTVCLFVGLTIGGMPTLTDNLKGKIKPTNILALIIPAAIACALCFLPIRADVNLIGIGFGEYVLLFLVGILGSAALVIPGISGSMILLILGYYNSIISVLTDCLLKGKEVGSAILVLATVALGIAFGFVIISFIMKYLLTHFKRGTYFAITGFIIGSLPTVFVSTYKESGMTSLPSDFLYWLISAVLLILGIAASLSLVIFAKKKSAKQSGLSSLN